MNTNFKIILDILGSVADILGVASFILLIIQGSQIIQLKQEITLKNKKEQFKKNKQQLVNEAKMYISLLEEKKVDDKTNFYSKLIKFLSNLEYFQDIDSIKDIRKFIKKANDGIEEENDIKILSSLVKIQKICERKLEDYI